MNRPVPADPWHALRRLTPARIALGRSGASLPTTELLAFGVAQAGARDAVHDEFDPIRLGAALEPQGQEVLRVHSAAADRAQYLRRPDLGRRLDAPSRKMLLARAKETLPDLVLVVADGLSARAPEQTAPGLIAHLRANLAGWRLGPVVIAQQARVALGDEIGECLGARQVAVLIGERPGLSAPDSLGLYLTFAPRRGCTDAQRNCISNVRIGGLDPAIAARRLAGLLEGARRLGASGVELKEEADLLPPDSRRLPAG